LNSNFLRATSVAILPSISARKFRLMFTTSYTSLARPWRSTSARVFFVAAAVWLFSAGLSYDLYNLWKLGFQPPSWRSNLLASSLLYASAGLMWNLAATRERGVVFGFMLERWPDAASARGNRRIFALVLVFVLLVGAMMIPFFVDAR
jgi:hypothetical protein